MRRSKAEIYLHLIWTTWERAPLVTPDIERAVYRCIQEQIQHLKATLHAIGGMPDHVHVLVAIPTTLSAAKLAQQVKGVSSTLVRQQLRPDALFRWQDGFGVFSVTPVHVPKVIAYIENQKRHHTEGSVHEAWETAGEELDVDTT